jgi:hypothetical protein
VSYKRTAPQYVQVLQPLYPLLLYLWFPDQLCLVSSSAVRASLWYFLGVAVLGFQGLGVCLRPRSTKPLPVFVVGYPAVFGFNNHYLLLKLTR